MPPSKLTAEKASFLDGRFADGKDTKLITCAGAWLVPELFSSQEEADPRMLLHAIYSYKICQRANTDCRIIIKSSYIDMLVLCVYCFP